MKLPLLKFRQIDRGFIVVEAIVAFTILASATVMILAGMRRLDANLARTRCEAHLGMIVNQYTELYRDVPWDALSDAANNTSTTGYIRFGGGAQGVYEVPYRVGVSYISTSRPRANPNAQSAQVVVDVYWSPPAADSDQLLISQPGEEVEFRQAVISRTRY